MVNTQSYADIAERDADPWNQAADNVNKLVRVDSPLSMWWLVSVGPTTWVEMTGTGLDSFLELTDTPNDYSGFEDLVVQVNSAGTALEFGQQLTVGANPEFGAIQITNAATFIGIDLPNGAGISPLRVNDQLSVGNLPTLIPAGQSVSLNATDRAMKVNYMTQAQRDTFDLTGNVVPGMIIYNLTAQQLEGRGASVWMDLFAGSGDVVGPVSSVLNEIAVYGDTSGNVIKGGTGVIGGTNQLGIGVIPDSALHVLGALVFSPASPGVRIGHAVTSDRPSIELSGSTDGIIDFNLGNGTDFQGRVRYDHTSNNLELSAGAGLRLTVNGLGGILVDGTIGCDNGANGNGTVVSATDTLNLGNSTGIFVGLKDLNFGIGNLAPTRKLEVIAGDAYFDQNIQVFDWITVSKAGTPPANNNVGLYMDEVDQSIKLNNVPTATRDAYTTTLEGMFHNNSDLDTPEYYNAARSRWETVKSKNIVYVHSAADFPTAVTGVITLDANVRYIGDNGQTPIIISDIIRFSSNSQIEEMTIVTSQPFETSSPGDFSIIDSIINYSGTGTLLDMASLSSFSFILRSTFIFSAAGTLFDLNSVTAQTALIIENMAVQWNPAFPGGMGVISDISFGMQTGQFLFFATGLVLEDNAAVDIKTIISVGANTGGTHLTVNGTTQQNVQISGYSTNIGSTEYGFYFDPTTAFNGVVVLAGSAISDPLRAFQPGSFDQTTVGFKFLGNANIPDSTALLHMGALNQGGVSTTLSQNIVQRIVATFSAPDLERFTFTAWGNMEYLGGELSSFLLNSTITGTVATGTNIAVNFYLAVNNSGLLIDSMADGGAGTTVVATTNQPHGYANGDRIIQENTTTYDGEFTIFNATSLTYEFTATWVITSIGFPAKVILDSKTSNDFSGQNKNTTMVTLEPMITGDILFLCVENVGNSANWLTEDIHAVLTKV